MLKKPRLPVRRLLAVAFTAGAQTAPATSRGRHLTDAKE
jgi:hypothetical protein